MSMMNTELYNALRKVNVPEDLAEAAARSVVSYEQAATKTDITQLRSEMATDIAQLRSDMTQLRAEVHSEIETLRIQMIDMRAELIKWMVGLQSATLLALIGAVIAIMGRLP